MIQNANIEITNIEAKMASTGNMRYTLTDTEKKKYTFFQNKKTGEPSDVYLSFTGMSPKVGDVVGIGFIEEPDSFTNPKGELVNYTKRSIVGLMEPRGFQKPVQKPLPLQASQFKERNWEREAFEKCCSIWAAALIQHMGPDGFPTAKVAAWEGNFYNLFKEIKDAGEKYFDNPLREAVAKAAPNIVQPEIPLPEELPVLQENEDYPIDPDQIPF